MKNLLLITNEFPFLTGEVFLNNELPYLSKAFKHIYIFSLNGKKNDVIMYHMPDNVTVFPLEKRVSKNKYLACFIKGIISRDTELKTKHLSLKRKLAAIYVRGRATQSAERIINCINSNHIDVENAIVYSFWFFYQAIAAWKVADYFNAKGNMLFSVSRAHGYDLYWERTPVGFIPFQNVTLSKITMCFTCSENGKKYMLKKYPWAENKIRVGRLGTEDYGVNFYDGDYTLVTCSRLESLKRTLLFAEAFCEALKCNKKLKWICIGDGPDREKIIDVIEKGNAISNVRMMGQITNERIMHIYKTESIMYFCNISTSEGVPVSIMEAMSFGIPIIGTNVGGVSELVDSNNGVLVSSNLDKEILKNIILQMVEMDRDSYDNMRKNSRKKWLEKSSARNEYDKFCNTLNDIGAAH